jgi:hypothetical protein
MSQFEAVLTVGALCWIAYQVSAWRLEDRQRHVASIQLRRRAELDDELKSLCPNLFTYAYKDDLRVWQDVLVRNNEYFRRSRGTLLDPFSDEPDSWWDIYWMYIKPLDQDGNDTNYLGPATEASDEERKHLNDCRQATEAFVEGLSANTRLTSAEIAFSAYWEWRSMFIKADDNWKRVSRSPLSQRS